MNGRLLSLLAAWAFVGSVYILPGGRKERDSNNAIIQRVIGVAVMTAASFSNFCYRKEQWSVISFSAIKDTLVQIVLISLLYSAQFIYEGLTLRLSLKPLEGNTKVTWNQRLRALRDYVVGPICEEIVFRGAIHDIYAEDGIENKFVRENFLYFAPAHFHHGLMSHFTEDTPFKQAMLSSFRQFIITGLFATYTSFIFTRTQSIYPCIAAHMICNFFGPPQVTSKLSLYMNIACLVLFITVIVHL